MLKCFPKCVSQRKSIFEQFSPHYVKIIQNSINFFIATWVRTVAKVLRGCLHVKTRTGASLIPVRHCDFISCLHEGILFVDRRDFGAILN